ncbi:hypothetical protein DOS84_16515 [Flavobacterium aquariorum]|uniref:Nicotinate-nucleotide adenylyltransferase n=1 Tax=Flavobacterium aquariorum TaxID=2217670 RepID=A0A2W7UA94_9FLAO|nr:hypothetical protein [Flavobacterium aquariorum]PZX92147.1 hypothetical protein DOS84_16515 [Flavobacterium aquariorum]
MKAVLIIALVLGMHITSYSQDKIIEGNDEGNMNTVDLPEIVIKNAGKDFSYYLPDKNPDITVNQLEKEFVAYDLGKDYEGYENYLVILSTGKGSLSATYDVNGKLTSVVEKYTDTMLPHPVIYSVYKAYPGWQIVNDKYLYTQENGDVTKKEYNLKLKKDNEVIKLKVNPKGEIISKS